MNQLPVIMPRPENMGPIPVPPPNGEDDKEVVIKESHLKREVWLAFNRGYNDGFVRGFHDAMQRQSRAANRRTTPSGQRFSYTKDAKNKK